MCRKRGSGSEANMGTQQTRNWDSFRREPGLCPEDSGTTRTFPLFQQEDHKPGLNTHLLNKCERLPGGICHMPSCPGHRPSPWGQSSTSSPLPGGGPFKPPHRTATFSEPQGDTWFSSLLCTWRLFWALPSGLCSPLTSVRVSKSAHQTMILTAAKTLWWVSVTSRVMAKLIILACKGLHDLGLFP